MAREALQILVAAERAADSPRAVAQVRLLRAQLMRAWGFPWNAFVGYREAQLADTTWNESALTADRVMDLLRDPTLPVE
jgi:hypothetical protein